MIHQAAQPSFPPGPLIGACTLVALALVAVAASRLAGPAPQEPLATAVVERDLRFEDRSDGTIAVYDARNGQQVDVVPAGTNGFLRATLRGLARERKRQGDGPQIPFHLAEGTDGRVTLEDPATGRRVALEAFGSTNAAAFARLLPSTTRTGTTP